VRESGEEVLVFIFLGPEVQDSWNVHSDLLYSVSSIYKGGMHKEIREGLGRSCVWWAVIALFCLVGWHSDVEAETRLSGIFAGQIGSTLDQIIELNRLVFRLTLRGDTWHTSARVAITEGDFSSLSFSDHRQVGPTLLQTNIAFDPKQDTLSYFSSLVRFQLAGIWFANYAYYPTQKDQAYDQITFNGVVQAVLWRTVVRLGLCEFDFRTATLQADWTWAACRLDLRAVLSFSCEAGFDRFALSLTYPDLPILSFGSMTTDIILDFDFELEEKSLSPKLRTRLGESAFCVTPLYAFDLGAGPLTIDGVTMYGVKLEAAVGDAVEFYAATSFEATKNTELTGNADYFEVYRVGVRRPSCCDTESLVVVAFYFDESSPWLFDMGMVSASADLPVSKTGHVSFEMEYPVSGEWMLKSGWEWRF